MHERIRAAALVHDEQALSQAIEAQFARLQPHAALIRDVAITQRQARELAEAESLHAGARRSAGGARALPASAVRS